MYICRYCNKECKNKNSLVQHEIRCKQNPDRIKINSGFVEYNKQVKSGERKPTNQFIKARELGLPIPERTKETRDKLAKYQLGRRHPEEIRLKIQSTVLKKLKTMNGTMVLGLNIIMEMMEFPLIVPGKLNLQNI